MIYGRNLEITSLNTYYERENSQILVLYGERYVGKTTLLKEFMKDKSGFYFLAKPASEREQKYRLGAYLASYGKRCLLYPEFSEIFSCFQTDELSKTVIVIDEFQNIVKSCPTFMDELVSFIHSEWNSHEYLIVLASSSIAFVENSMISRIGAAAFELSGFIKLKELTFNDLKEYFSLYTNEECACVWAILGGLPGLWALFDEKKSLKDNIIKKIISKDGPLHNVAENLVDEELRETTVYNTILSAMASGKRKLNDLYEHTMFSRAKISVYIKNLMELELVKKVFSVDSEGRDNMMKGVYDINNHFVDFYYTFMHEHACSLEMMSPEDFYKSYILHNLKEYANKYFSDICREYLENQNEKGKLPFNAESFGTWVGKNGNISVVGMNEFGDILVANCFFDKPMVTYADYENLTITASTACLESENVYLFANGRFDEKLTLEAKVGKNLKLIQLENM